MKLVAGFLFVLLTGCATVQGYSLCKYAHASSPLVGFPVNDDEDPSLDFGGCGVGYETPEGLSGECAAGIKQLRWNGVSTGFGLECEVEKKWRWKE